MHTTAADAPPVTIDKIIGTTGNGAGASPRFRPRNGIAIAATPRMAAPPRLQIHGPFHTSGSPRSNTLMAGFKVRATPSRRTQMPSPSTLVPRTRVPHCRWVHCRPLSPAQSTASAPAEAGSRYIQGRLSR